MKLLLWGVIGFIVVMWLLRGKKGAAGAGAQRRSGPAPTEGETMIRCAHCGVYVPASESVADRSGGVFCSDAHRVRHDA